MIVFQEASNISFSDFYFAFPPDALLSHGMSLIDVGPRSSTWTRGFADPDRWCELFDPDLICTASHISIQNIYFENKKSTDPELLIRARKLVLNPDYPNTRPQGGTGYGILKNIHIE